MIAVITGGSAGIGRATAERLARNGASVVITARRAEPLAEVAAGIMREGGKVLPITADVTDADAMTSVVDATVSEFGRIDVMVCNAGIGFHGRLADTPPDAAEKLVRINLLGTIHAARAAAVVFHRQGAGHLIAVSSVVGLRGVPGGSVYSATKAAQKAFIESVRSEWRGTGLHASVVFPISTRTEFRAAMARDFGQAVEGLGPRQDPDLVAAAIERCIQSPRAEVYPYWPTWWLGFANTLAPSLVDRLMQRFERRRKPVVPARADRGV
jgi:short-subunit dehydrogenase